MGVCQEQAKTLKDIGFPQLENAQYYYIEEGKSRINKCHRNLLCDLKRVGIQVSEEFCAPSLAIVCEWLRDEKNIDVWARPCYEWDYIKGSQKVGYTDENSFVVKEGLVIYEDYNKALSVGINSVIKELKNMVNV